MSALSREDFSSVWKDGGNVMKETGLTLNLVEHLEKQRKIGSWVLQKEKLLQLLNFGAYDHPVTALDIGSGLGVDVIAMAKDLAQKNQHGGKVIGLDFNTEMINHANSLLEKDKPNLSPKVSVSFVKEDCSNMKFLEDNSVDVIRSDITLMHLPDPVQTLKEIKRVLKPGGYFLSLEGGGPSGFYTTDSYVKETYNKLMPPNNDGGIGVKLWFWCQELGLQNVRIFPETIIHTNPGEQDPGWVKLRGLGEMIVKKGAITREVADEYIERYIKAAESNQIITVGTIFLTQAQKPL